VPIKEVTLHDEAAGDYDAAFEWYLEQSPDAAFRFDEAVERAITQIAEAPQRWVPGAYGTRRFLIRGFPYLLIYRELNAEVIQILAVAHTSRRPDYWKERV
jgi:toxin ParE1/3/4